MKIKNSNKLKSFTLTELLIVLLIIGILILLVLPDHTSIITKAKATEAKLHLENIYTLERTFFFEYSKYSGDLIEIGYEAPSLVSEGGGANYQYSIEFFSNTEFVAKATAVVDFDNDGVFNVWEINELKQLKEVIKD